MLLRRERREATVGRDMHCIRQSTIALAQVVKASDLLGQQPAIAIFSQ